MPKVPSYDVVIIGTGSAGFSAAEGARSLGASVCVIEKEKFGGECPNYACVPSKALLKAAKVYRTLNHARGLGIEIGKRDFDFSAVMAYRKKVVETITGGGIHGDRYHDLLEQLGAHCLMGDARFIDAHTLEVNGSNIHGKAIVIATGTVDFIPPILGLDSSAYSSWKDVIRASRQPKTMGIIGGGPVGCEIATIYASLGTKVTIFQTAPVILNREDKEISLLAGKTLEQLGVEIITGAQISEVVNTGGGVTGVKVAGKMHAFEELVVATGKRPNIATLGLEEAGVLLDERGALNTTKEQRTNVKHILAAGDVDGGMQFTHTAHHEGWVAGYNAALSAKRKRTAPRKVDLRVVPRATFIDPEVASVGLTEAQARKKHETLVIGRWQVAALGRAVTDSKRFGLIKLVAHPKTRKLLGAHIIGERAGEVIHEAALAIYLGATIDKLSGMIHAFPTYSEGLKAAAAAAKEE